MIKTCEAVAAFVDAMEGVKSSATIEWYRKRLGPLVAAIGDKPLSEVTLSDLRGVRASLARRDARYADHPNIARKPGGLSPWTLHGYVRAMRRFFRWALDEGLTEVNPARRLELPKLPATPRRGIADDDLRKIINAAKSSPRNYALVMFLADTCCRVGGLVGLRVEDLDLGGCKAMVCEKGNKSRVVFLSAPGCAALRAWLVVRPAGLQTVFGMTAQAVYCVLRRLAKRAGVKSGWNPHSFRHAGARSMLEAGAPLAQVSQILGHSDVGVTVRHYGSFAESELQAAHDRYLRRD